MFLSVWLIDRYVFRSFLRTTASAFVSLVGLLLIVDIMLNADELFGYAKLSKQPISRVLFDFYVPRILQLFDQTAGLLAMGSAMLTVSLLERHLELTALMSAGVSKLRIARPILLGTLGLSVLGIVNREVLLPKMREGLAYNAQDLNGQTGRTLTPRYDHQTTILFSGARVYPRIRRIESPQFRLPAEIANWGSKIEAEEGFYLEAEGDRPAGYHLKRVSLPQRLADLPAGMLGTNAILLGPHQASWLADDECFVVSDLSLDQLTGNVGFRRYYSTRELLAGLRNRSVDFGNEVKVILHSRFIQPVLDFVLLFLGLSLVLGRSNRNIFMVGGVCVAVVGAFFAVTLIGYSAGANYLLRPTFAAWLPLFIFGPTSYAMARPLWD